MNPIILLIEDDAQIRRFLRASLVTQGYELIEAGTGRDGLALAASRAGVAFDDDRGLERLLPSLAIHFDPPPAGNPEAGQRVLLGGEDVSALIRTPPMSLGASAVSARPVVRAGLLELQRRLAAAPGNRGAVLEGRDIGTVVFPDADAKFFLSARPEVRARRRFEELRAKGDPATFEQVLADQLKRDRDDSQRAVAPLRAAADAVTVDTSDLSLDEVVERLAREVEERCRGDVGRP